MFRRGEIDVYFRAVDWLTRIGEGWCARYLGAGAGIGTVCKSWKRGEVIAVPYGANNGGVSGSGLRVMAEAGWTVGNEGAIVSNY